MNTAAEAIAKKPLTDKQLKLKENRATALKNLTARLGKPARAANAARLTTLRRNKPDEAMKFIDELIARNGKPVKKPKNNLAAAVPVAKNKTMKMNKPKANNAKPKAVNNKPKTMALTKPKVNRYHTFKYNSVEREAKKLLKKVEEIDAAVKPLGYTMKDVCKICRDLRENV